MPLFCPYQDIYFLRELLDQLDLSGRVLVHVLEAVEEVPSDSEVDDLVEEGLSAHCIKRFSVVYKASEKVLLLFSAVFVYQRIKRQDVVTCLCPLAESKLIRRVRAVGLSELYQTL